ncbi:phosphate/phosphite/phosphonate ABC transporter substrate-binding protein [Nonomuraea sp. NPDC059194]|uniref:Rv1680 family SBP-like protein n=1 Tax=Nonomuraea sp. NPDC059194 TaxID=3346764 RepID=UPI0036AD0DAC
MLTIGAVAYTANVVPIWEGIRGYFEGSDAEMDFVLFSNYARQVDSLLAGTIDIAWNTNLAWVRTVLRTGNQCHALAMRDTDLTFATVLVARAGSGMRGLDALHKRRIALGSRDSAHAAILPVHFLTLAGVTDVDFLRIDSDLGKHGDTGRSELDAIRAVLDDQADAAAIGINSWEAIGRDELMPGALEEVWRSEPYCHCNFTTLLPAERTEPWVTHLLKMDWNNPDHRRILEMEGLRRWVRPQLDGYASLFEAVDRQQIPSRW